MPNLELEIKRSTWFQSQIVILPRHNSTIIKEVEETLNVGVNAGLDFEQNESEMVKAFIALDKEDLGNAHSYWVGR